MNNNELVPEYLYRGVVISYQDLKDFKLDGIDMRLPYEPYIDKQGRKTVHDGNEYGIYMSDNLNMVKAAYGQSHGDQTFLSKDFYLGINDKTYITLPNLEVIYKISTNNLEVRKPWISKELSGHYNNGFDGNEWIADMIPAENYEPLSVIISDDILHDRENVAHCSEEKISEIFEQRKARLEVLLNEMQKLSPKQRMHLEDRDSKAVLKKIYGKNGFYYVDNINDLDVEKNSDIVKLLMAKVYDENREDIDFNTLKKLQRIENKILFYEKKGKAYNLSEMLSENFSKEMLEKFHNYIKEQTENDMVDYYEKYNIVPNDSKADILKKLRISQGTIHQKMSGNTLNEPNAELITENSIVSTAIKIFKNDELRNQYDKRLRKQKILSEFQVMLKGREDIEISDQNILQENTDTEPHSTNGKNGFQDCMR